MQEWMWEKENVIRLTIVTGNQTFPYNTTLPQPELTTQLPFLDTLGYNAVQVSASFTLQYTLQRKSDLCTPRKETARRQVPFFHIHGSVSDLYIPQSHLPRKVLWCKNHENPSE